MSASFTNQTLAQIELFANNKNGKYKKEVYVLPKSLDEKVARLHLAKIGVKLTELRKDQADYIGVPQLVRSRAITTGIERLRPRRRGDDQIAFWLARNTQIAARDRELEAARRRIAVDRFIHRPF